MVPSILSLSSQVVYGHVGAQAFIFPLQCHGFEVWHLPSVIFSNHPGHGQFRGQASRQEALQDWVDGLADLGLLDQLTALHTGYLANAAQVELAARLLQRARMHNPDLVYFLDPVLGDHGRLYVEQAVGHGLAAQLLPKADILSPNHFELAWLSGQTLENLPQVHAAAQALRGPQQTLICTSAARDDQRLTTSLYAPEGGWVASQTRRNNLAHGTGDLFSALYLAGHLKGWAAEDSLRLACGVVSDVLAHTDVQAHDLALINARAALTKPTCAVALSALP